MLLINAYFTIPSPYKTRNFLFYLLYTTLHHRKDIDMETRIALIGIIIENNDSAEKINTILHEYGQYIVGRMGIPYRQKGISVISVIVDAPNGIISALSGKLGMLPHVSAKTVYSKMPENLQSLE